MRFLFQRPTTEQHGSPPITVSPLSSARRTLSPVSSSRSGSSGPQPTISPHLYVYRMQQTHLEARCLFSAQARWLWPGYSLVCKLRGEHVDPSVCLQENLISSWDGSTWKSFGDVLLKPYLIVK